MNVGEGIAVDVGRPALQVRLAGARGRGLAPMRQMVLPLIICEARSAGPVITLVRTGEHPPESMRHAARRRGET